MAKKGKWIKRDDVDYVEDKKGYSTHRSGEVDIQTPTQIIYNFIDKIPYVNVTFTQNVFTLSFNRYITCVDLKAFEKDVEKEFDDIIKAVKKKFKDIGMKCPKIKLLGIDVNGVASYSFQSSNYSCKATFQLGKDDEKVY